MCLAIMFCIETDGDSDTDSFDEENEINNPANPVWEGAEVHQTRYGPDPTVPDPNEVTGD